jgi:spermidine/putrescine transport system permease protein
MRLINKLSAAFPLFIYTILWAPVFMLVIFSFSSNRFGIKWEGFTLRWYAELFTNSTVKSALYTSLIIAIITVIVSTIAGTLLAYGMYKYKFRGKEALRTTVLLPMVMPSIVTGAALLVFFSRILSLPLGYASIIIAHITFSTPLAMFVVLGRMARVDWSLEEASADLGANKFTTWRKITLPVLFPAMITSAAMIFPWSFDDVVITYFVSGVGTTTLPIYVFSQLRYGTTPVINTIGTIFVMIPILGVLLVTLLQNKGKPINSGDRGELDEQ